jgi:hypothetical protein
VAWGTGAPSEVRVWAKQEALLLGVPGDVLRRVATAHSEVEDALWQAVGTEVTSQVIRRHFLSRGAPLVPWQLARIMGKMEMHHVGVYHAQTLTFNPSSMVVLIAGEAKLMLKPLLLRLLALIDDNDDDGGGGGGGDGGGGGSARREGSLFSSTRSTDDKGAEDDHNTSSSSRSVHSTSSTSTSARAALSRIDRTSLDGCRGWDLLRRAWADKAGRTFVAPAVIMQSATGDSTEVFRVAFGADSRFASEEDAIYRNPTTNMYLMDLMVKISDRVVLDRKRAAAAAAAKTLDERAEPAGFAAERMRASDLLSCQMNEGGDADGGVGLEEVLVGKEEADDHDAAQTEAAATSSFDLARLFGFSARVCPDPAGGGGSGGGAGGGDTQPQTSWLAPRPNECLGASSTAPKGVVRV